MRLYVNYIEFSKLKCHFGVHIFYFEAFILYVLSGLGFTAGAHRLWSHRSYKAKLPLQVLLLVFNTIAHQYSVIR